MPRCDDVEKHLDAVLTGERQHCARRVAKEEGYRSAAASASDAQVSAARVKAEAAIAHAEAERDAEVRRAEERLRAEEARCAAELAAAQARAAEASRLAAERLLRAEAARDAARPEIEGRVAEVDRARQQAVSAAEAAAAAAEAAADARTADAERREEAARARANKLKDEAAAREAQRREEVDRRCNALETEAEERARHVQHATADLLELHVQRMRNWILRSEKEWEATRGRLGMELHKADRQASEHRMLAQERGGQGETCLQVAECTRAHAARTVHEARAAYDEWRRGNQKCMAEEVEAYTGLEELARALRAGALVQPLALSGA